MSNTVCARLRRLSTIFLEFEDSRGPLLHHYIALVVDTQYNDMWKSTMGLHEKKV